ncbi:hypothetical protein [Sphingosinicella terrae]|uniref:hypothetical protein n=1 Tax=Sphingosinicella terrae TaxID=2172047 RepID=UPI000E0D2622|nr:hypothetical protein [Sphingosinicella terrae]
MRDRGITRPGPKAVLAAGLALAGAAAVGWSVQDPAGAPGPARPLGIVVLIVGTLAMLNYLYAWTLVRRMRRGERVIGRWTVAPATFARFREAERARRKGKNNWRMPRRSPPTGLKVIFTDHSVLVGETYFSLRSKGLSRFTFARIEAGAVASVEFAMTLTVIGAGTQGRTARYRGHLRVPIADDAHVEAARVLERFQG